MTHRKLGMLAVLVAAGFVALLTPAASEAQVRIGVSVGGGRGGVGYYGGGYAPYGRGYGYPGSYGYGYPGSYGYGRPGVGIGFGVGAYPYYNPGLAYPTLPSTRYYNPFYTPYVYTPRTAVGYVGGAALYAVPPTVQQVPYANVEPPAPRVDNAAQVELRVPAGAKVLFDGAATTQTGAVRRFASPELVPGYDYTYTVSATWTENGKPVTRERKVIVQAGGSYVVDLTGEDLPTIRNGPGR